MVEVEPVGFDSFLETLDFTFKKSVWRTCRKSFSKEEEDEFCLLGFRKRNDLLEKIGVFIPHDFKMVFKRENILTTVKNPKGFYRLSRFYWKCFEEMRFIKCGNERINERDDDDV